MPYIDKVLSYGESRQGSAAQGFSLQLWSSLTRKATRASGNPGFLDE
jgi:hypothetical protein